MPNWSEISRHISEATGQPFAETAHRSVGGGSINAAYVLQGADRRYFVKLNDASRRAMFEAEAEGLKEIMAAEAVRVPRPICWGADSSSAYIVLEYLALNGKGGGAELGRQLACLHQHHGEQYGWRMDNTIGSTPQINTQSKDWVAFFHQQRLGFQLSLAARHGHGGSLQDAGERLLTDLGVFFADYKPAPSLLHGDLWSGNYAVAANGEPVIFDPAVYYGDREADLAMTELFGAFPRDFYSAYQEALPLDPGYRTRKTLYNLYHILNHLNLFGGGYRSQAEHMMDVLLSEFR